MASENTLNVTDENFEMEVLKSPTPTLVDFWAVWCAPCRALAPAVDAIANDFAGKLRVAKMDIDKSPKVPTRYDVRSIPTLLLFANGQVVGQMVGAVPKEKLQKFIQDHLAKVKA